MPNRIPTPGIALVGVRSAATDNAAVNVKQQGTVGGKVKGTVKAAGPKNFNKLAK
jgi:hypothetical protein